MKLLFKKISIFLEMIKFEHSIFALPFAYMGLILAEGGWPSFFLFFWVTLAMVSFRTYGMAINRIIDKTIDAKNPRTSQRALPQGQLSLPFVGAVTLVSLVVFVLVCAVLGPLCLSLSIFPILFATLYPWMKRFSWMCHFVLGFVLGIAPYGAWIAARGDFSWIPGLLTIGVSTWVAGFDIIYALADLDFDRRERLFSVPARFGHNAALRSVTLLHSLSLAAWLLLGKAAGMGAFYYVGFFVVLVLIIRENWLIRKFGTLKIQEAFFKLNACISMVLFLAVLLDQIG